MQIHTLKGIKRTKAGAIRTKQEPMHTKEYAMYTKQHCIRTKTPASPKTKNAGDVYSSAGIFHFYSKLLNSAQFTRRGRSTCWL